MPFGSSQWMYSSGFYPTEIDQSLRFDGTSYLSRTFGSGNRKTWTWSSWVKRSKVGATQAFIDTRPVINATQLTNLYINASDVLVLGTGAADWRITTQVFRDTSAWFHLVCAFDSTNATANNRVRFYVNGEEITSFSTIVNPTLNTDYGLNQAAQHCIGTLGSGTGDPLNGYLADTYFVDGTALDPTSFGEFKSRVWIPKAYTGSYGTNGFHLTYQDDTVSEGFNTVTYNGDGATTQNVTGVGFQPDFTWIKERSSTSGHVLADSVRGYDKYLVSNETIAESTGVLNSVLSDGFRTTNSGATNQSGQTYVAWNWDAGDSTVSNTDGSITSSVRANPAYGFSVVTFTGTGADTTVGHGLGSAPKIIITKGRNFADNWHTQAYPMLLATQTLALNTTLAATTSNAFNNTAPTSSVFSISTGYASSGRTVVAYCFSEIAGYSKFGSYTGTGASGNAVTTGFKPAFVIIKRTNNTGNWITWDNTRITKPVITGQYISLNISDPEEGVGGSNAISFNDTGFTLEAGGIYSNSTSDTFIYMAFADTRDLAFWRDQSGNGNDWQPNNLNYQDTVFDSPTNNYCTLNPLVESGFDTNVTYSEGNLKAVSTGTAGDWTSGTIGFASGKYYFETTYITANLNNTIGIWNLTSSILSYVNQQGAVTNLSGSAASGFTNGDIIGTAINADDGLLTFYKNNVAILTNSSLTGWTAGDTLIPRIGNQTYTFTVNFGQSGFTYTPPTDFLALCTANLPEPSISPLYGASPQDYFNTVLYTGNGSTQSITGVGFQPDWVWFKARSFVENHALYDSVRGATKDLRSDTTNAENTNATGLTAFGSDGFSIGSVAYVNQNAATYAAWNWKASNATAVSNTAGTITSQVSANPTAGFSIVSYTGTGSVATVGHGLGVTPDAFIVKRRTGGAESWYFYTQKIDGSLDYLKLNTTDAKSDSSASAPTSTVFSVSGSAATGESGSTYIAYCFSGVEGYSKFGSYTGNGSSDGPFVYTGFRPAWVMVKQTSAAGEHWEMWDSSRGAYNLNTPLVYANLSNAEGGNSARYDVLSNGLKLKSVNAGVNASGATYIYMAFAENPFKYANAR